MRSLYLVDEIGATFEFNYKSGVLISDLAGLGIERTNTYIKYEETYEQVSKDNPITQITATLTFLNGYEGYKGFISYLRKSTGKTRLFYKADTTKYAFVSIVSLTKTELNFGVLQSSITIDKLSMWLDKKTYVIEVNVNDYSKVFPYKYPFVYSLSYNGEVTVTNSGCTKAPIRIEIYGKVVNPEVHIAKDGLIISSMRLFVTSNNSNSIIVVEAESTSQEMSLNNNGVITDIYKNQDFECDNFLFLDVGTYQIRFNPGVSDHTTCKFTFLEQYEGN